MIVIPGRIPIIIHPFFWACAGLIGWMNSGIIPASPLIGTLIWVAIVFVSVVFHELGHALMAVLFRQKATIQLVALGGLTSYEGPKLTFFRQFLIVLNGPLFGIILAIFAGFCMMLDLSSWPLVRNILFVTLYANIFWSVVNLIPVLPLDGGQLLRIVFEAWFGLTGYRISLLVGACFAALITLASFLFSQILIGALFALFAFQGFDLWRKSKSATKEDRDDEMGRRLEEGERALQEGKRADAERIFSEVCTKTSSGLIHMTSVQYLALLKAQEGHKEEAYQLLLPIEAHLAEEMQCLLHQLASEHQNWPLVAKLSVGSYQSKQTQETALINARAFAHLHQAKPAGGWLQTAWREGRFDLEKVLREDAFQEINKDPDFQHFLQTMR
jgi:stage IV sporulation protein FB